MPEPIRTVVEVTITSIDAANGVIESEKIALTHIVPQQISVSNIFYVANNVARSLSDQLKDPFRETVARQIIKVLEEPEDNETPST